MHEAYCEGYLFGDEHEMGDDFLQLKLAIQISAKTVDPLGQKH